MPRMTRVNNATPPKSRALEPPENLDRWLLTYADMITLLTMLFLMLYSMSVMNKGKFSELALSVRSGFGGAMQGGKSILPGNAQSLHTGVLPVGLLPPYGEAINRLRRYVDAHHLQNWVRMSTDNRGVVISLVSDNMLFERGQAQLKPDSAEVLTRIGLLLKAESNPVIIEGHTCDLPIRTERFPSNWELSTARAGTVLRYFTEEMGLPGRRFTAAGYADTRPLAPNTSEANRARNRRVDIVILQTEAQRQAALQHWLDLRRSEDNAAAGPAGSAAAPILTGGHEDAGTGRSHR
ncbi:MAG TPA: OmpA family protein [Chthonomonadaceae bacterium]|nr:OmpA family protein [Chthonomonadaceae bacterium]